MQKTQTSSCQIRLQSMHIDNFVMYLIHVHALSDTNVYMHSKKISIQEAFSYLEGLHIPNISYYVNFNQESKDVQHLLVPH